MDTSKYTGAIDNGYHTWRMLQHALAAEQDGVPAPEVCKILDVAKAEAWAMAEAVEALSYALTQTLQTYDLTDKGDARANVRTASATLNTAANLARQTGGHMEAAQKAIAAQDHRGLVPKLTDDA